MGGMGFIPERLLMMMMMMMNTNIKGHFTENMPPTNDVVYIILS